MPSETTLQYHTHLQAWFVIIVNSFIYGSTIMIRLAATLNGTWSSPIPLFTIPSQFLQKSDFCYAGKVGGSCFPLFHFLLPLESFIFDLWLSFFSFSIRAGYVVQCYCRHIQVMHHRPLMRIVQLHGLLPSGLTFCRASDLPRRNSFHLQLQHTNPRRTDRPGLHVYAVLTPSCCIFNLYTDIPQVVRVNASLVRESISERQAKANLL